MRQHKAILSSKFGIKRKIDTFYFRNEKKIREIMFVCRGPSEAYLLKVQTIEHR